MGVVGAGRSFVNLADIGALVSKSVSRFGVSQ